MDGEGYVEGGVEAAGVGCGEGFGRFLGVGQYVRLCEV